MPTCNRGVTHGGPGRSPGVGTGLAAVGYHRRVSTRCLYTPGRHLLRLCRAQRSAQLLQGSDCCKGHVWRGAAARRPDEASYKLVSRTCSGAATRQRRSRLDGAPVFQHMTTGFDGAHTWVDRCIIRGPALRWVISGVGVMARRPPNDGASWSARELQTLRALAKAGTPTGQVAKKLGRTAAAVQQKAMRAGISFRAAKRSGARRKK